MATIRDIVEGLEILAKTATVPPGLAEKGETDRRTAHLAGADHDILFGPECNPTEKDVESLKQLGWHFDEDEYLWARFI